MRIKRAVLVGAAVIVVLWVLAAIVAYSREKGELAQAWPAGLGSVRDVPGHFPAQTDNESATKLIVLAAACDVRLGAPSGDHKAAAEGLNEYVRAQLQRGEDRAEAAPPKVAAILGAKVAPLDAVRAQLLSATPPRWTMHIDRGLDAPLPNLLGHMELTRLFVARALDASSRGDAAAWEDLHAAWNLGAGVRTRPELISQLISLALARTINGAARTAPGPRPAWMHELADYDVRHSMLASMQGEAWMMHHASEKLIGGAGFLNRVENAVAWPYAHLMGSSTLAAYRRSATELAASRDCDFRSGGFSDRMLASIPSWNIIGRIALPNFGSMWQRVAHYGAEREATAKVIDLRSGVNVDVASTQCSDGTWSVAQRADGARVLKFSRKLTPANAVETVMPMELVISR